MRLFSYLTAGAFDASVPLAVIVVENVSTFADLARGARGFSAAHACDHNRCPGAREWSSACAAVQECSDCPQCRHTWQGSSAATRAAEPTTTTNTATFSSALVFSLLNFGQVCADVGTLDVTEETMCSGTALQSFGLEDKTFWSVPGLGFNGCAYNTESDIVFWSNSIGSFEGNQNLRFICIGQTTTSTTSTATTSSTATLTMTTASSTITSATSMTNTSRTLTSSSTSISSGTVTSSSTATTCQ
ncbi:unnamed protein product [Prorocentrum cordatum]|uniref:Uncharacterized protein n=1 Tax=Prorocentrum cordatum TaxID=2364126 RepID=A0ABN9UJY6_9DINO|nr:unnamed protein product [Polarella glacialis]